MVVAFSFLLLCVTNWVGVLFAAQTDNINGYFAVKAGRHYSNKTSITWGRNSETYFSVRVSLSESCATYDLNGDNCPEDPSGNGDFNKLWGRAI